MSNEITASVAFVMAGVLCVAMGIFFLVAGAALHQPEEQPQTQTHEMTTRWNPGWGSVVPSYLHVRHATPEDIEKARKAGVLVAVDGKLEDE